MVYFDKSDVEVFTMKLSRLWSVLVLFYPCLEVCTGFKLKPEPGPYPRSSDPTRPDPSGTVQFKARTRPEPEIFIFFPQRIAFFLKKREKDAVFQDCMQWSVNKYM